MQNLVPPVGGAQLNGTGRNLRGKLSRRMQLRSGGHLEQIGSIRTTVPRISWSRYAQRTCGMLSSPSSMSATYHPIRRIGRAGLYTYPDSNLSVHTQVQLAIATTGRRPKMPLISHKARRRPCAFASGNGRGTSASSSSSGNSQSGSSQVAVVEASISEDASDEWHYYTEDSLATVTGPVEASHGVSHVGEDDGQAGPAAQTAGDEDEGALAAAAAIDEGAAADQEEGALTAGAAAGHEERAVAVTTEHKEGASETATAELVHEGAALAGREAEPSPVTAEQDEGLSGTLTAAVGNEGEAAAADLGLEDCSAGAAEGTVEQEEEKETLAAAPEGTATGQEEKLSATTSEVAVPEKAASEHEEGASAAATMDMSAANRATAEQAEEAVKVAAAVAMLGGAEEGAAAPGMLTTHSSDTLPEPEAMQEEEAGLAEPLSLADDSGRAFGVDSSAIGPCEDNGAVPHRQVADTFEQVVSAAKLNSAPTITDVHVRNNDSSHSQGDSSDNRALPLRKTVQAEALPTTDSRDNGSNDSERPEASRDILESSSSSSSSFESGAAEHNLESVPGAIRQAREGRSPTSQSIGLRVSEGRSLTLSGESARQLAGGALAFLRHSGGDLVRTSWRSSDPRWKWPLAAL
eukprot:TRINITY_DN18075_c0_g1_i1.p1 TRINITY_DN18075_c0_g1~~TRINITY_DN18075_c0_g1_i1.p1  ORF type:complete len:635 (+),score=137.58 TRINITY_DN18075_c0_g1_i1:247-2151(+)